jgi:hypothetical protein
MGQIRTADCERIDNELRAMYPEEGVEIETQKDTYSEDYIVWLTAGEIVQPVRVTVEEYAAGDWVDNLRAAIDLLLVQQASEG